MSSRVIKEWANEGQQWIFERGPEPTLLVGGINSGKTVGCVLKMLALLHQYPGSRGAVVRRSYTQLTKTTMESWYQWCTPDMYQPKGSRTEGILNLNNGSRVYFIHLDQPNSLDLLAGLELNFVYISQAEEIAEKAFDLLDVRIGRWTGATIPQEMFDAVGGKENWKWRDGTGTIFIPPRYIFAEGYVTDEGHWLYRRFAEESPEREKYKALGYESKIVWSENNKYAIKATLDAALTKDEDYIRRFVRPSWGNPEGKIFRIHPMSLLLPTPNILDRIKQMKLHRSLDHGEFSPTCCLWHATDYDGNIFTYREYYVPDKLVSDHRQAIFKMSKEDGLRYYSNLADPSIFNKSRGRSVNSAPTWSIADEYTDTKLMDRETTISWIAANNEETATRSRLKEYLRIDPKHRHPISGQLGAPHLYFIIKTNEYPHGCAEVTKDIGAQMRMKSKSGDREIWLDERDPTIRDHGYDTEKYFVISRPSLGPELKEDPLPPGEIRVADFERAAEMGRSRKRLEERRQGVGRLGYGE